QLADHGTITLGSSVFTVTNVQKDKGGKYLHHGRLEYGEIKTGDSVHAAIDTARRQAIRRAHSATHLLQYALEQVLGDHCHQAGSLVEPDHLRFDFTHFSAMTPEEIAKVNHTVMEMILTGYEVETLVLPIAEAQKLGATALFGEKYGDIVRVVKMGPSMEFCGGTHLDNTAKAGLFRIVSEGSVASGVRRIEAITGPAVLEELDRLHSTLAQTAEVLKTSPGELTRKAEATVNEVKELRQQLEAMKGRMLGGELQQLLASAREVKGLHVLSTVREGMDAADLRKFGDLLRDKDPNVVGVIASEQEGKISVLAVCGANAVKQGVKAGVLIKTILAACGGSGGGKPDSAMGGCKDPEALKKELEKLPTYID
ncbi:MAG: alanine--tRNA ligase, partial [Oscillospiraceae bacterium]|nr:alanine--tRNA ligase [Oscillospiraceae bacterium]